MKNSDLLQRHPGFAYRASLVVGLLLLISSIGGLAFGRSHLYDVNPKTLPALLGQDAITLLLALPLLFFSIIKARRGSLRGLLLWIGMLFYFAYSYYFYVIGVKFNILFIPYILIVGLSIYGLLSLLYAIRTDQILNFVKPGMPVRVIGRFFILIATLFIVLWTVMVINHLQLGIRLEYVARQVISLDGMILLPLLLIGGIQIWKRRALGYLLAGVLLIKSFTLGLTLLVNTFLLHQWGQAVDPAQTAGFTVVLVGGCFLLLVYLRHIGDDPATGN